MPGPQQSHLRAKSNAVPVRKKERNVPALPALMATAGNTTNRTAGTPIFRLVIVFTPFVEPKPHFTHLHAQEHLKRHSFAAANKKTHTQNPQI
jgi:hypothetical protein